MCDSTVAGLSVSPTPFLGCPLQRSAGGGWGGETESVCYRAGQHTGYRSPPAGPKTTIIIAINKWGGRCLVTLPLLTT